ncbi:ABC transporter ATP-binding protein [Leifsonia sp. TF02-11]|uniref:dipeptide ABC transporter ATP-binding protein n=1 Tax=Leifsonia sp. TF02-11 TaxID=2815212 RepID=UPI001AA0BC3A|nr:ABC transporter ATP-binding protein [Leifsonia sp. TF02-11]MBO1737272.1 ABC transporter ATP-binding protein [Leifsonia sp. TF02-11]
MTSTCPGRAGGPLLEISGLRLDLPAPKHGTARQLLHGIDLAVADGETVGLVGESGSGKSLTARTVLGLLPDRAQTSGSVLLDGTNVLTANRAELKRLRLSTAAMIFQDPRAGINPMRTLGDHLTEALRLGEGRPAAEARARAIELLAAVHLPHPEEHLRQYPHEFSGGMLQRVMIAGALAGSPKLLVCDEPTTALDVTTQAQILDVLAEQREQRAMGMLFITHDLTLAAAFCDRVYVMREGKVVEQGAASQVLRRPANPYTQRLVAATPTIEVTGDEPRERTELDADGVLRPPVLVVHDLAKTYQIRGRGPLRAVSGATIAIPAGEALGVVGESGSGKSTLARMIVGLEQPDAGTVSIDGAVQSGRPRTRADRLRHARRIQMVFQDPYLSLDPRMSVGRAVEDALRLHHPGIATADARAQVLALLGQVGLVEAHAQALPRTLSGGQRQRVAIARALAIEPAVLVMDEATSALDVSVQAQVLDVVSDIRRDRGLTVLFISHNLGVVRTVCERTVVMRSGEIVESGRTVDLLSNPQHEYTRLLLDSVPRAEPDRVA